jgi:hypothetical protein
MTGLVSCMVLYHEVHRTLSARAMVILSVIGLRAVAIIEKAWGNRSAISQGMGPNNAWKPLGSNWSILDRYRYLLVHLSVALMFSCRCEVARSGRRERRRAALSPCMPISSK